MPITAEEKIKVRLKIFQNCLRTYRTAILAADPSDGHRLLPAPSTSESFLHYVENDRVKVSTEKRNDPKGHHRGVSPWDPVTSRASLGVFFTREIMKNSLALNENSSLALLRRRSGIA